jgi:hypothetical protein
MDKSVCKYKYSGYIGKPVPLTPTFLGVFLLNQYYSRVKKPHKKLVLVKGVVSGE